MHMLMDSGELWLTGADEGWDQDKGDVVLASLMDEAETRGLEHPLVQDRGLRVQVCCQQGRLGCSQLCLAPPADMGHLGRIPDSPRVPL